MRASIEELIADILGNPEDHDVERVLLAMHLADRIGMNVPHRLWEMRPFLLDCLEQVETSGEGGRA